MSSKHKSTKGAFGGRERHMVNTTPQIELCDRVIVPDDIKIDIAKVARSVDWHVVGFPPGGRCFFRAVTGWLVLRDLGIPASLALGGMVYRVGPDEERDVVAFCGPRNIGCVFQGRFLGHYWVQRANDIIDFSVGDWRELTRDGLHDVYLPEEPKLDPIQRTVEPPYFFWADQASLSGKGKTPELGHAWYWAKERIREAWNVKEC